MKKVSYLSFLSSIIQLNKTRIQVDLIYKAAVQCRFFYVCKKQYTTFQISYYIKLPKDKKKTEFKPEKIRENQIQILMKENGGLAGIRTQDPLLKRQVLLPLSYQPVKELLKYFPAQFFQTVFYKKYI